MAKFKTMLHGKAKFDVLMVSEKPGLKASGSAPVKQLRGTLKTLRPEIHRLNVRGYAAFAMVNTSDGRGTQDKNVVAVNALFIDYDGDDWSNLTAAQLLAKFKMKPHMLVRTSRGHYHVYWLIADGSLPLPKFKALQQQLARKYGADEKVCNLARFMRVPGTFNHKQEGSPYLSKLLHCDEGLPKYELDSFVETMLGTSGFDSDNDSDHDPSPVNSKQTRVKSVSRKVIVNQLPATDDALVVRTATDGTELELDSELEKVTTALASISPDDRDVWVKGGMALKTSFGDRGFPVFIDWSSVSSKFDYDEAKRQWDSFSSDKANGVGLGTIYFLAKRGGSQAGVSAGSIGTDFEFSEYFVTTTMAALKYDPYTKCRYTYVLGIWQTADSYAEGMAREFIQTFSAKHSGHTIAKKFLNANGIKDLLRLASSDRRCHVQSEAFNADPNIIGVKAKDSQGAEVVGVISLTDGTFRSATPEHFLTKVLGAPYLPDADCPAFRTFLMQITDGDLDVEKALQVIFGYTLYGHTKAQLMFIFVGSGANGKGVLLNVLRYVFGKWATAISYTLIRQHTTNPNAASPALAALAGARLIVCSEATKGAPLEEAFIKNITGSDPISCRGNYADQSTFIPQGTLLLATNDFPKVSFDDQALWRRTYPVHFKIQFQGDYCDPGLEDKLKAEASGILNWLIEGAISYHQCGKIPWAAASLQYLEKLKQASDTIGNWLRDCCKLGAGLSAVSSTAFASYKEHAKNQHAKAVNQKEFKEILNQKGYPPKRKSNANVFMGFSIKPLQ